MIFNIKVAAAILMAGLFLESCSSKMVAPKPLLGSPEHHVENGFKLLEMEKIDSALREFKMAQELDPDLPSAYLGLGLAYASKGDYKKGLASLETAKLKASDTLQKVEVLTGFMRFYTQGNEKLTPDWLNEVQKAFKQSQQLDPLMPGPHFFMGRAYKQAGQYEAAANAFIRVFEIGKDYVEAADREYSAIQKLK